MPIKNYIISPNYIKFGGKYGKSDQFEIKKSAIKYCIFYQFMYKNIKVSVTLTLTLKVSGGLDNFSLKCIVVV